MLDFLSLKPGSLFKKTYCRGDSNEITVLSIKIDHNRSKVLKVYPNKSKHSVFLRKNVIISRDMSAGQIQEVYSVEN